MEGEYNDCKFMTFNDLDCSSLQQLVQWALSLHTHSHIICVILKNNGLKSAFTVTLLKYFQKYLLAVYELQAFQVSFSRPFLFLSHNFNFNKFQAYLIFLKFFWFSSLIYCSPSVPPSVIFHSLLTAMSLALFYPVALFPLIVSPLGGPAYASFVPIWFIHRIFFHQFIFSASAISLLLLSEIPASLDFLYLHSHPQVFVLCHLIHSPFFLSSGQGFALLCLPAP